MGKLNGIELKRARLVPSAVFTSPAAIVRSTGLTRGQKIQILRRWEFDVRRTGGGIAFADLAGILSQVQAALAALGALTPVRRGESDLQH